MNNTLLRKDGQPTCAFIVGAIVVFLAPSSFEATPGSLASLICAATACILANMPRK